MLIPAAKPANPVSCFGTNWPNSAFQGKCKKPHNKRQKGVSHHTVHIAGTQLTYVKELQ